MTKATRLAKPDKERTKLNRDWERKTSAWPKGNKKQREFLARRVEVRRDGGGLIDEVCTDACGFHLEMMDDKTCWIGLTIPGREDEVHITISTAKEGLSVVAHEA